MNIDQMKYIIEVSKEKSVTRAAAKLHLSASAISQSISQLENEMGFAIFSRSKKGMNPTLEGKVIIAKSYEILNKIQELHDEIALQKSGMTKVLKVACTPAMTDVVYNAFILFNHSFNDVKVIILELDQDRILMELKNGNIEMAFASYSKNELDALTYEYGIGYDLIYTGFVCVCVNSHSHLARYSSITPDDLINEKVVIYNSKYFQDLNDKYLVNKDVFVSSNNIEVMRSAILHGFAFSLLYNFTFKNNPDVNNGKLVIVPFKKPDIIYQDFWCLSSLTKGLSPIAIEFEKKMQELLKD